MPIQKDLKRIVRSRMKKTGESYTAARLQVLNKKKNEAPVSSPAQSDDLARIAGMSETAIRKNTGHTWVEWVQMLDKAGAATMEHGPMAMIVSDMGVPGWWTQAVAVGYERIKGIRAKGQRRNGTWEASKSRTFPVPVKTLFAAFASPARRRRWLDRKVTVRTAKEPKSMRVTWDDGTSVELWFMPKGEKKSAVAVQHTKLATKADADRMKVYWAERLEALGQTLGVTR